MTNQTRISREIEELKAENERLQHDLSACDAQAGMRQDVMALNRAITVHKLAMHRLEFLRRELRQQNPGSLN